MNWVKVLPTVLLVPALCAWEPGEPQQRKKPGRDRGVEQVISAPGSLTRQGRYWVEELTGSVPAAPRVRIESMQGGIELQGGAQQEITYRIEKRVSAGSEESARRMLAEYPLQVRRRGDQVEITIGSERGESIPTEYHLTVPKNTLTAELETRGGNIAAREIDGQVRGKTAGGGIEVDRVGGAELETAGGGITMHTVNGAVRAKTAGGNIKLGYSAGDAEVVTAGGNIDVGRAERSVRAQTAGGNITVGAAGGDVTAQTAGGTVTVGDALKVSAVSAGGSIEVGSARALVRAQTAAGSIRLSKCSGPLHAETAAGSITAWIVTPREAWAESLLETSAGDIVVYLPADLALTIRAAIERAGRHHAITSDFPLTVRSGGEGPGLREIVGEGAINGGGPPLRLRTTSGDIAIRKGKTKSDVR